MASTPQADVSIKFHFIDISGSRQLIYLVHGIDALPVPVVFQVGGVRAVFQ